MADATLFDDAFTITSLNAQKYDRVSRITGTSSDSLTVLSLDINTEIYPVSVNDNIQLVLASTLNLDGTKEDANSGGWRDIGSAKKVRVPARVFVAAKMRRELWKECRAGWGGRERKVEVKGRQRTARESSFFT